MITETQSLVLDAENPWPGLLSFPEEAEPFFHGRDTERDELLRLIRRETLTLLYGQSGLGKSSLIMAGVAPQLRRENMLPVYVRLDHDESSPILTEQLKAKLVASCLEQNVEAPEVRAEETLWELLHRTGGEFWSARNHPVTPVFILDQFEEVFTLGRGSAARDQRSEQFLRDLGCLIDNRPSDELQRRIESNPDLATEYTFARTGCKIVLSLREDFLPELEQLTQHTRSTLQNRLRLMRMSGEQALEAVLHTGGHLIDAAVAPAIVRFLARAVSGEAENGAGSLGSIEIEPALLSVFCRELNERRKALRMPTINTDLLRGSQEEILANFYGASFRDLPNGMRVFVEEKLVTEAGYRDSRALEEAVRQPGVTLDGINVLVNRRLLRREERFGTARIELTHDVLTKIVRESRDRRRLAEAEAEQRAREQQEHAVLQARMAQARKQKRLYAGFALVSLILAVFAVYSAFVAGDNARAAVAARSAVVKTNTELTARSLELDRANATMRRQNEDLNSALAKANAAKDTADLRAREAMVEAERADDFKRVIANVRAGEAAMLCVALRELSTQQPVDSLMVARIHDTIERLMGRALDCAVHRTVAGSPR
jgi:hypothetical protein